MPASELSRRSPQSRTASGVRTLQLRARLGVSAWCQRAKRRSTKGQGSQTCSPRSVLCARAQHESDAAHGAAPADGGDRVERDPAEALAATSANQSGSTDAAQRYLQWAETRSFLVTEAVLAVAFLGLLDGAFSGAG